ncbi:unnamed protein product [Arabidopsis lyrata]|uniref:Predicted protein n=1 Tax=Arabidopsis lyrata subsp. lyrata TaxID=81972 RepID=D7L2N0_ARALL|nr:predicted protein [Arabidopsis lyrata subsp. lyrata]CAH8262219.1 unnamed protein product [Arabidopsis lyrata]
MANKEDINCPIYRNGFMVPVLTNCHHRFCGKCILVWLTQTNIAEASSLTCPNCRASVTHLGPVGDVVGENS